MALYRFGRNLIGRKRVFCLLWCLLPAMSLAVPYNGQDLTELSLEQLLSIEVRLTTRKGETLRNSPAAVYVLNHESIERSGATTIPEMLRLVPGVEVTQFGSGRWSVTIRGFNDGVFTNRILILVDGRSMFSPAKAGMFWDALDTLVEDIERIEVVRGPGSALWGANAFNGVVNIVTRNALDTQGGLLAVSAGDEEKWTTALRYGAALGSGHARAYLKAFERDDSTRPGGEESRDGWTGISGGVRFDSEHYSVQANAYDGHEGEQLFLPDLSAPPPDYSTLRHTTDNYSGFNLQLDWQRRWSERSTLSASVYADHSRRKDLLFDLKVDAYEANVQQDFAITPRHQLVWGLGYRYTEDDLGGDVLQFDPRKRHYDVLSGFAQYSYAVVPDRLRVLVGSKFEDNDFSGGEIQPNARAIWTPSHDSSFWLAISRANRSPSRVEQDAVANLDLQSLGGGILQLRLQGDEDFDSEELLTHELGWRQRFSDRLSVDVALFHNQYSGLRSLEPGTPFPGPNPPPDFILPVLASNGVDAKSWGGELLVDVVLSDIWRTELVYSNVQVDVDTRNSNDPDADSAERNTPQHRAVLRSLWDLPRMTRLTAVVRYVDDVDGLKIDEYTDLDLVLSKLWSNSVELSLVGRNLLDKAHEEFVDGRVGTPRTEVERSVYLKCQISF